MQQYQRYEYEDSYRRYSIDNEIDYTTRRRERKKASAFSAKDRKLALMLLAVLAIVGIMTIVASATAANLRYQVNALIAQNQELENEIADVDIKIQSANSVSRLERKARTSLGMVYPSMDQIVYIEDITAPQDFAAIVDDAN